MTSLAEEVRKGITDKKLVISFLKKLKSVTEFNIAAYTLVMELDKTYPCIDSKVTASTINDLRRADEIIISLAGAS